MNHAAEAPSHHYCMFSSAQLQFHYKLTVKFLTTFLNAIFMPEIHICNLVKK